MFRTAVASALLASALASTSAQALDFYWSFSAGYTDAAGTQHSQPDYAVYGRVLDLADNATSYGWVWIDGFTNCPTCSQGPINTRLWLDIYAIDTPDYFTVTNGVVTDASFHRERTTPSAISNVWDILELNFNDGFNDTPNARFNIASVGNLGASGVGNDYGFAGITFTPLPEPATWAMMLIGFGMVGFGMRQRRVQGTILSLGKRNEDGLFGKPMALRYSPPTSSPQYSTSG